MQKYQEAIADYTKALEIDPNHAYAFINREIALKALQVNNNNKN